MPELLFDTQDAVPEVFRSIAAEKDGKFAINVVPKTELDEFRNNNLNLARERDSQKSLLGRLQTDLGFDPENVDGFVTTFNDYRNIKQQVDDGKLVADSSLEAAVEAKTGQMKSTFEQQINGLKTTNTNLLSENEKLKTDIRRNVISNAMMEAINHPDSGALPAASKHIMREAYDTFSVDDHGDLVPKDSKGNIIYGSDGATPMTPKEFLAKLEESNPFFFKDSQGGGAGGGGGGGSGGLSPAQIAAMSPEEKMNYGRKHNMNG